MHIMNQAPQKNDSMWIAMGVYGAVGFQLAFSVIACLWFGNWLDEKLGTAPWLMFLGLILGSAAGFWNLIRLLQIYNRKKS